MNWLRDVKWRRFYGLGNTTNERLVKVYVFHFILAFHAPFKPVPCIVEACSTRRGSPFHTPWKPFPHTLEARVFSVQQVLQSG